MPIHTLDKRAADDRGVDVYAADLACHSLPKRKLPDAGVPAVVAYALVRDELILDGNSRQNLATFCTTWMEPKSGS
jgi:glutamate decarboxylase